MTSLLGELDDRRWSDGNSANLTITGNTFNSVRTGLNLDGYDDATTNVSFNTFVESGSGISIGTPSGSTVTGIHDNTFDGVDTDFNLQNVTTSQSIDLDTTNNVSVNPLDAMVVLGGTASDTITGSDGVDALVGHGTNHIGNDDNALTGKAGADLLVGAIGTGTDTANYAATITAADIASVATDTDPFLAGTQTGWTVNGGAEGTDTLSEIEIVDGAEAGKFLLVGNGGYDTLTDAVAAAADGDTIMLAGGFQVESFATVDKSVTILGAQHGNAAHTVGVLRSGLESSITGGLWITAAGVVIDGLRIQDGATIAGVGDYIGVFADAPDVTVKNTIFDHLDTDAGDLEPGQVRGLVVREGANYAGDLTVEGNAFFNWTSGIYLSESYTGTTAITGNLFVDNYAGIGGVEDPQPDLEISGNIFRDNNVEQIGVGVEVSGRNLGNEIFGNTFEDTVHATDLPDVTIYAVGTDGQVVTGTDHDDLFWFLAANNQVLHGGLGNDLFIWNDGDGNDTINGDGGTDTLEISTAGQPRADRIHGDRQHCRRRVRHHRDRHARRRRVHRPHRMHRGRQSGAADRRRRAARHLPCQWRDRRSGRPVRLHGRAEPDGRPVDRDPDGQCQRRRCQPRQHVRRRKRDRRCGR